MTRAILSILVGVSLGVHAQETSLPDKPTPPAAPNIKDLGEGKYQIGLIAIDQKTRTIRFPATLNLKEGKLEFALVHEQGKIHESLLATKVDAFNLNVALKLLRYQESPELFRILDEDYRPTGKYHEVNAETKAAARLDFLVSWNDGEGKTKTATLNELILHTPTNAALLPGPWIYGGSYVHGGAFQAKAQGELAALFTSSISLFNHPGIDHELDDVWEPNPKRIPALGTAVTVILQPYPPTTK